MSLLTSDELSAPEQRAEILAATLDSLNVGVFVWRLEQDDVPASLHLLVANRAACSFLGVTREQVLGRSIHQGFPGSEAAPLPAIFTALAMQGGARDLGVMPYSDDIVKDAMVKIHAEAIGPRLVCVRFTNVSEQLRLEALQQTNEELVQRLSVQAQETRREAERSRSLVAELEQQLEIVARQSAQIVTLSSPILDIGEHVLAVPLIGEFDGARAAELTPTLLTAVVERRIRAVILDVTGISDLDPAGAGQLARLIGALRLLGAEGIVTGISPRLAQTLGALGSDAGLLRTYRSLSDGLRACSARRSA